MKKIFLISFFVLGTISFLQAQKPATTKKPPVVTVKKVQPPQIVLKNLEDSANYAIGMSVGNFYKSQGVKKINSALVTRGITDVLENKTLLVTDAQANSCMTNFLAQVKNAKTNIPSKVVAKKINPATVLKTLEDSANYSLGMSVSNFYKIQGVPKLNASIVVNTVTGILAGQKALLNEDQSITVINNYLNEAQLSKSKPAIMAGEQFLAENKKKPGVVTTGSGLQYEVITQGTGPKPTLVDTFVANYKGMFLNGTVFDESYSKGQPLVYPVTQVIKGWTEALLLMPAGSKYKLYIPYNLAYGVNDYFSIPGGSLLIFELELLDIKTKK